MNETEEWKDVPGYEGRYIVSSHGRVVSLPRTITRSMGRDEFTQRQPGKTMRTNGTNYATVSLCKEGVCNVKYVHELVASLFIGPRPSPKHQVCHNDGDGFNPKASNLRYDTPTGNASDRQKHGTGARGEENPRATLTEDVVRRLKVELKDKAPSEVSRDTGIPRTTLSAIKHGYRWGHVH